MNRYYCIIKDINSEYSHSNLHFLEKPGTLHDTLLTYGFQCKAKQSWQSLVFRLRIVTYAIISVYALDGEYSRVIQLIIFGIRLHLNYPERNKKQRKINLRNWPL